MLQTTLPEVAADSTALEAPLEAVGNEVQRGIKEISTGSFDDLISGMINHMATFALHLAVAILVFYVGRFIIKKIYNLTASVLLRRKVDTSLSTFVLSLIKMTLYFILIVTVIGIIGIETSSFIALFASAGVALGMALSGTLQNFAGGVLILLLKPYKVGDYIEAQGYAGTVTEIQIFCTIICTYDNKSIIIPNGGLSTGSINNWSREEYRRVDWKIGISYGDSVETARRAIFKIIESDSRVVRHFIEEDREERQRLEQEIHGAEGEIESQEESRESGSWFSRMLRRRHKRLLAKAEAVRSEAEVDLRHLRPKVDCSPKVVVTELGDSSVNLVVRAWTRSSEYWGVYHSILERIYTELPSAGVSFPFPQMDVHVNPQA